MPVIDKSRGSKSAEVQRVWRIYDDMLQFMTSDDALSLDEALEGGDVSRAWSIWSSAEEAALADAYQFSGGPVPDRGLVLGRGAFLVRAVRLGGPKVRKARRNFADPLGEEVICSCIMMLLPLSCLTSGVDLMRLGSATCFDSGWDYVGQDFELARRGGLGGWRQVVEELYLRLSDFIHGVVGHRREEAFRRWQNWLREDPLVHPCRWRRPDLVPPAPFFCSVRLISLLVISGVLADPGRMNEEFRKAWLPYFCRSGQRDTSLQEFDREVDGWLPLLPEVALPRLTGEMLADVVRRKGAAAGSLDGRGWREFKALPVPGLMVLLVSYLGWKILEFGRRVCLMLILP